MKNSNDWNRRQRRQRRQRQQQAVQRQQQAVQQQHIDFSKKLIDDAIKRSQEQFRRSWIVRRMRDEAEWKQRQKDDEMLANSVLPHEDAEGAGARLSRRMKELARESNADYADRSEQSSIWKVVVVLVVILLVVGVMFAAAMLLGL